MSETRLEGAKQKLVGALERLAGGDRAARDIADGVEDDLTSILTLVARITPEQLRLVDVQDVFAHLLDHVITECWEPATKDQDLSNALDGYVDMLASRLEAKLPVGARHSEKLEHVFASYWEDAGEGEEDEDDPLEEGSGDEEELGKPDGLEGGTDGFEDKRRRTERSTPARRPAPRPTRFPKSASVTGDVVIGEE